VNINEIIIWLNTPIDQLPANQVLAFGFCLGCCYCYYWCALYASVKWLVQKLEGESKS
jgi:hypothetical protein